MLNRQLGSYTIVAPLGAGGMGEVYRARDEKLGRDVAIKILPPHFTADPDRGARFKREARILATLNHPNIAAIYAVEESNGMTALVLELIEGTTLASRLEHGPLKMSQTVTIARQIVEALDAAHEKGIVHRDLKPANIILQGAIDLSTSDIRAKVLDFGLAKPAALQIEEDATISVADTVVGRIVGTPAYMSPEQARGLTVDARTDIWAFGCVLYEMIVGRPAFRGATTSDTIARILESDPDWHALPARTPDSLKRLLARCLEKDPKRRLHAIADARFELDEAVAGTTTNVQSGSPARTRTAWLIVATMGLLALSAGAWALWSARSSSLPPPRVMPLTSYPGVEASPTFSPDGKQVAFSWDGVRGDNDDIYVVMVGAENALPLTTDPARDTSPAWKPDGSQIAFARVDAQRASVYVVSPLGGAEQKLADYARVPYPGTGPIEAADIRLAWTPDGRWLAVTGVMSGTERGVFLVGQDGRKETLLRATANDDYRWAAFSPGGERVALANAAFIEIADLAATDRPSISTPPRRVPTYLGYVGGLTWTTDGKSLVFGRSQYSFPDPPSLWRLNLTTAATPERIDLAGVASYPAVSAAGSRLAFVRRGLDVDLLKLEEGSSPEALRISTGNEQDASFSHEGSKIAFASDRNGEGLEVWVARADGSNPRLLTNGAYKPEGSPRWSPNDDRIAFDGVGKDGLRHVYVVGSDGGLVQMIPSKPGFRDLVPSWSRDGKWIYFRSNRSGRPEVWKAPAGGGNAERVTATGGEYGFESWDERTLYYLRPVNGVQNLFAMPLPTGPERSLGIEVNLWNYIPVEGGLYYMPPKQGQRAPYTCEVRFLDTATGRSRVVHSLRLGEAASPGLTVTKDGKTIVIAGATVLTQDLMRIENFR